MTNKFKPLALVTAGAVAGILISLGVTAVAQRDPRTALPLEDLRQFSDVFGAIKAFYVEPVDDKKLIQEAISGMVTGLDPHSAFLDAEAFKELQVGTQGEFGGLGIEVGTEDGFVKVVSPIEDTPAFRAGVKSGDLIIKIDDKNTKGMTLNDAVKLMRGKPKSTVTLTLMRKGEPRPIVVQLVRDVIRVQSVRSKVIEPGYGYLRLTQFQEMTVDSMARQLGNMDKSGPMKGLVLDLRNDPGGLLNGAVGVSAAFLPPKTLVVSTDGRTEDAKRKYIASPEDYVRGRGDERRVVHAVREAVARDGGRVELVERRGLGLARGGHVAHHRQQLRRGVARRERLVVQQLERAREQRRVVAQQRGAALLLAREAGQQPRRGGGGQGPPCQSCRRHAQSEPRQQRAGRGRKERVHGQRVRSQRRSHARHAAGPARAPGTWPQRLGETWSSI
jgi:C-terminal processing protease CtpA/Prc